MDKTIAKVRALLRDNIDPKTQESGQHYFKEEIHAYGVKVPVVNKIAKECFADLKTVGKSTVFELIEELWQSGMLEESFVACEWTYSLRKAFQPEDFKTFKRWIDSYVSNWASCDTFCNHSVGFFIETYPEFIGELKTFVTSENRWMRRAAAVSLIISARKGMFLNDIFEIADTLLLDKDDLVQKGYGWMLKAASQSHKPEVFDYVMKNKQTMPRTALRYAIEKMPKELKQQAMSK